MSSVLRYGTIGPILSVCSSRDDKILQEIFKTIGDHPDELQYQTLNVTNLRKIFKNRQASLALLLKFGFNYTANKVYLKYVGMSNEIADLLSEERISLLTKQYIIRACFRTDTDTRKTFDSDTPAFGVFYMKKSNCNTSHRNVLWKNRSSSDKIQGALCGKEICKLQSILDSCYVRGILECIKYDNNNYDSINYRSASWQLYVFNNNGCFFRDIDWNEINIKKLMNDCSFNENNRFFRSSPIVSLLLMQDKNIVNFCKKFFYFLNLFIKQSEKYVTQSHLVQQENWELLSILNKHESLFNKVSGRCIRHIALTLHNESEVEEYINNVVKAKAKRLKQSKRRCKLINKSQDTLPQWRCLMCNTLNGCRTCIACPSCNGNQVYVDRLASINPLYWMFSHLSDSISFGIDPRDKKFYIIREFCKKAFPFNLNDDTIIINKYRSIQDQLERKNELKLSTIIYGSENKPLFLVLFEKSKPLTLYELKHILFEMRVLQLFGAERARYWTFVEVDFLDNCNIPNVKVCGQNSNKILNKFNDDDKIDIADPCYVDELRICFDMKPRKQIEYQPPDKRNGCSNVKNDCQPTKVRNIRDIFEYQYAPFMAHAYHLWHQVVTFLHQSKVRNRIDTLIQLTKEVIKNGYEKDLQPTEQVKNINDGINVINNIVHEYELKENVLIHEISDQTPGNYGIFNQFTIGLIKELSKKYKIFDTHMLQSKMFHQHHAKMGYPLSYCEMLALMLYCNGECNYNLSESQRYDKVMEKWPYFHCLLNNAIEVLSKFEIHNENIYTGVCGVFFESNKEFKEVRLKTNVSFSTDLNQALKFRGDSGMVIGMSVKRIFNRPDITFARPGFTACDVSWISSFAHEKEILAHVASTIRIYPNLVRNRGQTQWIAFVEDELDQDKVFKSLFGSLAD